MRSLVNILLDTMGGDNAPYAMVRGALDALKIQEGFGTFFKGSFRRKEKKPIFTIGVFGDRGFLCSILPYPGENVIPDDPDQSIQFRFGGVPANGDPERAVHHLIRASHGDQNMAAVTLGAGRASGYADAVILQNIDGILGGNTGNGQIQNMGRFVGTVDYDTIQKGQLFYTIL